jgi:hypothetical protein
MALAIVCLSGVARSQMNAKPPDPFRVVWSSAAGCGDPRAFLHELEGRTTRLRQAQEGEHAITLIVETFRVVSGVRGQLTVRKLDGDLSVREVPGLNCQEVESAMALIAALMVDPLAGSAEGVTPTEPSPPAAPEPVTTVQESDWSLRIEQRLTAHTAVAPGLTWGQAFGVMLTGETSRLRPSVALSGHLARATTSKPQGSAELEWAAAQLALCPVGLGPGEQRSWDLRACGSFQVGRLRGAGFETVDPDTKAILWVAAGLELEGRYRVVGPLWLGLEGALNLPFSRERFYLEPTQTLHQVPAWGVSVGFGAGLRFF